MECQRRWKYGTILFLPLVVGVWKFEGGQQLAESPMKSFAVKILRTSWMVGIGVRHVVAWCEGCLQACEKGWEHV